MTGAAWMAECINTGPEEEGVTGEEEEQEREGRV